MLELDDLGEMHAIIRVIGIGAFGLRVVENMAGGIYRAECIGVVPNSSVKSNNLPIVSLLWSSKEGHHDVAPLLEMPGTPDLVFIVANLDEDEALLVDICHALHNASIYTFLVIPESACIMKRKAGTDGLERVGNVTLDGVLIISESSMDQPHPNIGKGKDASSRQDHFFQQGIRLITDMFTVRGIIGIDFCDVIGRICGRIMRVGVGIDNGEGRALKAAEKATACLIKQGVVLQTIDSTLSGISSSRKSMCMDDYNSVNKFSHEHFCFNDECGLLVSTIPDDSLADSLLVSFIAGRRPSEEVVFPPWVKVNDKYDSMRDSVRSGQTAQTERELIAYDEDEEFEVPSWLRKTI